MKKSRKTKHFYNLLNTAGDTVQIDLNNYKVTCVSTGKRKSFYHKYLYQLIVSKYNSNIDLFRTTYTSREAGPTRHERRAQQLQARINKLYVQISNLKGELADHESGVISFPDA